MAGPNELWRRSYHMSRYLIPVLLSIMALTLPAFAVLESQKCGPYLVSFDLTTNEEMKISRLNPTYYADHVIYYLSLINQSGEECGLIEICTFYRPSSSQINLDNLVSFIVSSYENMTYASITQNNRMIDGHQGFLVTSKDSFGNLHWAAGYWITNASTVIEMQGNQNWEMKDVRAMLDSVHVERVGF
jgi:hypothetical protein